MQSAWCHCLCVIPVCLVAKSIDMYLHKCWIPRVLYMNVEHENGSQHSWWCQERERLPRLQDGSQPPRLDMIPSHKKKKGDLSAAPHPAFKQCKASSPLDGSFGSDWVCDTGEQHESVWIPVRVVVSIDLCQNLCIVYLHTIKLSVGSDVMYLCSDVLWAISCD